MAIYDASGGNLSAQTVLLHRHYKAVSARASRIFGSQTYPLPGLPAQRCRMPAPRLKGALTAWEPRVNEPSQADIRR